MNRAAKFVKEIEVTDPDSKGSVHLAVYKHENGGMFAIDSSFIEQVVDDEDPAIVDPFSDFQYVDHVILNE